MQQQTLLPCNLCCTSEHREHFVFLPCSIAYFCCFGQLWSLEGQNSDCKMKGSLKTEKETISVRKQCMSKKVKL